MLWSVCGDKNNKPRRSILPLPTRKPLPLAAGAFLLARLQSRFYPGMVDRVSKLSGDGQGKMSVLIRRDDAIAAKSIPQ